MVSGWARRIATSAMDSAMTRMSCARVNMCASRKKKSTGTNSTVASNDGGKADPRRRKKTSHLRAVERGNRQAANNPDETANRGGEIRCAGGTMAQGLQDLANTGPVIIGGTAWCALAERPGLGRILRKEFGSGGRDGRTGLFVGIRAGAALRGANL